MMAMSAGHGEKQTRLREQAIASLLETPTIAAAAKQVGVDESTLRVWLKDPDFDAAFRDARRAVVSRATDRLARACADAVSNLTDVMANSDNDGSRVTASKAILDYAYKAIELEDLAARIARLEEDLSVKGRMT